MIYGSILCIGDSLTYGSRETYRRDYPFYLSRILSERYGQDWVAVAEGIPVETSSELATRAYRTIKKYPECFEVVILCGTNDTKDHIQHPAWVYAENIEHILRVCRVLKRKPYLCSIPDMVGFGAPDYSVRGKKRIAQYNADLRKLGRRQSVPVVELTRFPASAYSDGVHLNTKGYELVAKRVAEAIVAEREYK